MRVLVVEDTEDSRIILVDILRANGHDVDSAINGVDALEKIKQARPDLIISDILMPEMDGFGLCRQIKSDPNLQSLPLIFYTATYTDSRDEQLALSLGASRYVIKPQNPTHLLEIIDEVWSEFKDGKQSQHDETVADATLEHMHAEALNRKLSEKLLKLEQQEEELKLASLVFQNSSEGMMVTDANNQIIAVNPAFSSITGYKFEEVKGKNPRLLRSGRHDNAFYESMWQELIKTGKWQGEIWDKRKNGETYPKWLTINTIRSFDGSIHRHAAIFSDITEKKKTEELIWKQANFDTLTGLPNRNMFRNSLDQELKKSRRDNLSLALLLIDLDLFKEVNDTLGHDVGDSLLQECASRIHECVRETDIVARLGGDEFAVVLTELSDTTHADSIAQKISTQLAKPYHIGNEVVYVSGSTGITLYPEDATNLNSLLKNADQAMYAAKKKGRNCFAYFTQSLQDAAQTRLRLTNNLRGALLGDQFKVYFQPMIDLATGEICKAEALLRWQHPQQGMVAPLEFIPLAEETGLINSIGDWVFKESTRLAKIWNNQFQSDYQISVNMSPIQFKVDDQVFVNGWLEYLQEMELSEKNIVIEITEGLLLNAESRVTNKLLSLRDAGIQVAIDDFGTGYSSLSYLKKFDIDYLKIDRSFVHNLETDKNDVALAKAIIVMAHELGLKVVAEGIETEGQERILVDAGCDYAQGYLYAKPAAPVDFEKLLKQEKLKSHSTVG